MSLGDDMLRAAGVLPAYGSEPVAASASAFMADPVRHSFFDGGKFLGGFGETKVFEADYWTLRARSVQLFTENHYARGLIRRLVTNEINTGLTPEVHPEELLLGAEEGSMADWSNDVEARWAAWASSHRLCDWYGKDKLGSLHRAARLESLVSGDVLVVLKYDRSGRPSVQLVSGSLVRNPLSEKLRDGHTVMHGVEKDAKGRVVAYWVQQQDLSFERVPAYGSRTGRRIAWLKFGTDKLYNEVRGQPLLSLVMQSLKDLDRYRDAAARKAVLGSLLALFIMKNQPGPGSLPFGGVTSTETVTQPTGPRQFNIAGFDAPGIVLDELNYGEEPKAFGNDGTDINFGAFEQAILASIAWANEIPPEILRLGFDKSFNASQAALNEFRLYLNLQWARETEDFCQPIYEAWFDTEVISRRVAAPGYLQSKADPDRYAEAAAWVSVDWLGTIKPTTDLFKAAKGSELLISLGLSTRYREARMINGTKHSHNVRTLLRENTLLAEANKPLIRVESMFEENDEE